MYEQFSYGDDVPVNAWSEEVARDEMDQHCDMDPLPGLSMEELIGQQALFNIEYLL